MEECALKLSMVVRNMIEYPSVGTNLEGTQMEKFDSLILTGWGYAEYVASAAAAQRALTSYRSAQVLITKLEQKKWVFKQVLMKLETAGTDSEFAKALAAVNKVTNINVEMVEDVFDEAGDLLAEAGDTDKFWSQMYGKEVEGSKEALKDHIPSMEDLEKTLQEEVAGKITGAVDPAALEKEL